MRDKVLGIWRELRRRRVVSTIAAYAAGGFVLLQLAEILLPAFGLGPGALRVLLALLLTGFPIVVALSWVFDVTMSGIRRTRGPEDEPDAPASAPSALVLSGVMATAVVLGGLGWWLVREAESVGAHGVGTTSSIAVLPFTDLSEAGDQQYLGDGLAEEILNVLSGVDGLQVAARTSAFAFRNGTEDVRDIGEKLNVTTLLEGSVRRSGDRVRVTAQLIDTSSGFHLWSRTYDRTMEDLFDIQDEIAGSIAQELVGRLDLPGGAAKRHVAPQEAQDAYWRARAQMGRRDPVGLPEAITLLQGAVAADPEYAAAYAGLADAYALLPIYAPAASPADAWTQAEQWAEQAIRLDSTLADPYASLGLVRALRQDRTGALQAFGKAIELNPSYAPAFHWRANVLAEMGRLDEARRDATRAALLDPLSPAVATDHGKILLWSGDVQAAGRELDRALTLDFSYRPALFGSALVALDQGRPLPLQMALTRWAAIVGAPMTVLGELSQAMIDFRETGVPSPVDASLQQLDAGQELIGSGTLASIHALVGAREGMLRWLRAAVADGSWAEEYLVVNPAYDPYRDDPGFRSILEEIGDIG
jgi:TolB-like protein